ncbi:MAG: V-type ATP synthase subunit I [Mangrovibacterium sp.]
MVYHKEYATFLEQLREIGLLHVQTKTVEEIGENAEVIAELNKISHLIHEMTIRSVEQKKAHGSTHACPSEVVKYIEDAHETLASLQQDLQQLRKDEDLMTPWGDYTPETFQKLSASGFNLSFYIADRGVFDVEQLTDKRVLAVNEGEKEYYLCVVNRASEEALVLDGADEVQLQYPWSSYELQISDCEQNINNLEQELNAISADALRVLEEAYAAIQSQLNFEIAYKSGDKYADDMVISISGWVPVVDSADFEGKLNAHHVFYIEETMTLEDDRPIKLKNNWFNRLFEPIGDLYTLPTHREFDLTPLFAPFYMLFFGFCLGDAGYGLLIMLASLWAVKKVSTNVKPLAWLGFALGVSTTIMGVVTGTFFGMMFGLDPDGNPLYAAEWLRNYQEWIISQDNLMLLAFGLGFIQVVIGMLVKAVRLVVFSGFKYALSQIGWVIIVAVALPIFVMGNQGMMAEDVANKYALIALIVGAIPAIFYNSPKSSVFANFGTGLWDTYNMASGLLGDILSYVRLFALGLSSAILGNVFNTLAFELSPNVVILGPLVTLLILLIGHGLNFALALLGAAVHPLRLTFVEFYKNAGFEGGGARYTPFKR